MEENVKAFREAQDQSKNNQKQEETENEPPAVDVMQHSELETITESEEVGTRLDAIPDAIQENLQDTLGTEEFTDTMIEEPKASKKQKKKNKPPLLKLLTISKSLGLIFAKEAFMEDDPAALGMMMREIRGLATADSDESFVDLLHRFRTELAKVHKRAKTSATDSELTAPEIFKVDKVLSKVLEIHETLLESDLPFILEDVGDAEDGDGNLENLEDMDESVIDPADQEQLLDDEIYLIEIEEEEADDYTRWTEPILELIAVKKARKLT